MAFPFGPFIYLLLVRLTWAGPASTGSLTPALQLVIPACAQTCLEFFIAENFPSSTCGPPPNFNCLCTSDSTSGYTLGEGALECFESGCDPYDESGAFSVYDVCMTVPNARPNTHGTLTATTFTAASTAGARSQGQASSNYRSTTISSNSFTGSSYSSPAASSTASGRSTIITSTSSSILISASSVIETPFSTNLLGSGNTLPTTSPSSSTSSSTSATAAPASSPAPTLTKPQIAGVVVASVGAAAIAFGLCSLIFCFRRRRSNRRNSESSFGGDKIVDSEDTTPDMSAIATRDFGHEHQTGLQTMYRIPRSPTRHLRLETPATSSEDGWGHYQRNMAFQETFLAPEPQIPRSLRDEHSPITPVSNRTRNSQLLPEKPSYNLFPSPLKVTPRNSIPNQLRTGPAPAPVVPPLSSPFARAAPQHPSSVDTSQAHLQGGNNGENPNDPFTASSNRSISSIYPYFEESRPRPPPRSLRREPPRIGVPSWEQQEAAGVVRKPVPGYPTPYTQGKRPSQPTIRQQQMNPVESPNNRKSSRKKDNGPRPLTHLTDASETSFEDDEEDDYPDPRSALSPLYEVRSPPTRSPEGRVSYPAIPISASESPTRRPNPKRPPHPVRSDSLLTKRLGQDRARELADRLQGPSRQPKDDDFRDTAKYKILVSPGHDPLENSKSPTSAKSIVRSPLASSMPTPWRR